jgi:5'-methylthioadenosine/S-adenosylhomocysteine nucleosidase
MTLQRLRTLLIIVAMRVEEEAILREFNYSSSVVSEELGIGVKEIRLAGLSVLVTKSNVGGVNAALSAALISLRHRPDAILLMGVGGALQDYLDIGDIVVSSRVIQHDSIYSGDDGIELMAPGELYLSVPACERHDPVFETDPRLLDLVNRAIENVPCERRVYVGTVLTGSEFAATVESKNRLGDLAEHALLVEMEAFGAALVAKKLRIPFITIKTVADRLRPQTSISREYKDSIEYASANAAAIFNAITTYMTARVFPT